MGRIVRLLALWIMALTLLTRDGGGFSALRASENGR